LKAVLIFTVGPVQSFLAQARKTQDLHASSRLLSHFCRVAAEKAKQYGAEIVYPDLANPSLPNRLVAVLSLVEGLQLAEVGSSLERAVRDEVRRLGLRVVNRACGLSPDSGLERTFFRQLGTFPDIYWVEARMEDEDYLEAYRRAEAYLEAAKTTRVFSSLNEQGRKCSLTGEHNALFFRERRAYLCSEARQVREEVLSLRYLAKGEALGAVGMVKRCLDLVLPGTGPGFPSTAAVALMATLERLPREMWENYRNLFSERFDDQFYYEENLTLRTFEREGIPQGMLDKARKTRAKLQEEAERRGLRLTRYYAVLCMDADNMGKWIRGYFLEDPKNLRAFQEALTRALGEYAWWVRNYLVPPRGSVVYCGGDDVLALVNLNYLIPVLEELRCKFPRYEDLGPVQADARSSTSCGVCIAHYKQPLAEVLERAWEAERKAKEEGGRDAWGLVVLKRSGEPHQAVYKWSSDGLRPLDLLRRLVKLLAESRVSDTFIRVLAGEFVHFRRPPADMLAQRTLLASEEEMVTAELRRLLRRSWQGDVDEEKDQIAGFAEELAALYALGTLDNFLSYLETAAFLAREVNRERCASGSNL